MRTVLDPILLAVEKEVACMNAELCRSVSSQLAYDVIDG